MGAWGSKSFDNDDAADWVHALEEQGATLIAETLNAVLVDAEPDDDCHPEAAASCEALAAAELVISAHTRDTSRLSEPAQAVLQKLSDGIATAENLALAKRAVQRVRTRSELYVLWAETDDFEAWTRDVDQLIEALQSK